MGKSQARSHDGKSLWEALDCQHILLLPNHQDPSSLFTESSGPPKTGPKLDSSFQPVPPSLVQHHVADAYGRQASLLGPSSRETRNTLEIAAREHEDVAEDERVYWEAAAKRPESERISHATHTSAKDGGPGKVAQGDWTAIIAIIIHASTPSDGKAQMLATERLIASLHTTYDKRYE